MFSIYNNNIYNTNNIYNIIITYFDSFGVAYLTKEKKIFIGNKNITTKIYNIQEYDSTMCEHFCLGFMNFMLKSLFDYTN